MTIPEIRYTICFIRRDNEILLLNREKNPWMGMWNGVGGKIEPGEDRTESVLREVFEETGIRLDSVTYRGIVWWSVDGQITGGMYAFVGDAPDDIPWQHPNATREGILDWKPMAWVLSAENGGVVPNIRHFLPTLLKDAAPQDFHCKFMGETLQSVIPEPYPENSVCL